MIGSIARGKGSGLSLHKYGLFLQLSFADFLPLTTTFTPLPTYFFQIWEFLKPTVKSPNYSGIVTFATMVTLISALRLTKTMFRL